ncbi:TF-B3 domain-containing protein [Heracleum sosnowskyi]|uniref:TF-B3 domain-containing protein n=1 Tax=Heracleum sosnowskyi TaxID=360622 RepID=A0AAD8J653_9APIA|nr:TF-B3 domain-containing protein [Heracleum sosnowskyi]
MEACGLICEKFAKLLSPNDVSRDEMSIPPEFCFKYDDRMALAFNLILRTGYRLPVRFNPDKGTLDGLLPLYRDLGLNGGELLVFEYYGRFDMNLYVIGSNSSEIDYPHMVHDLQTCKPLKVSLANGGWRFTISVDLSAEFDDEIDLPQEFMDVCATGFPRWARMILRNGKVFIGTYDRDRRKLSCLRTMHEILGRDNLENIHILVFTYDGVCALNVTAFDKELVEIVFPGTPTSNGERGYGFEITVHHSHMLKFCHGVDISREYKDLCNVWGRRNYINVYSGESAWRLQVRKRSDWKRTTIHDGWLEFRESLGLEVGATLVFHCAKESCYHFSVTVIKQEPDDI